MKIELIEDVTYKEPLLTIRCDTSDNVEVKQLLSQIENVNWKQLLVFDANTKEHVILLPSQMLYAEIVERHVYLYTNDHVYETHISLTELTDIYQSFGFFRCSKTLVVNLYSICRLKSIMSEELWLNFQMVKKS